MEEYRGGATCYSFRLSLDLFRTGDSKDRLSVADDLLFLVSSLALVNSLVFRINSVGKTSL